MKHYRILAVNPGSTSTKVALFDELTVVLEFTLRHSERELKQFESVIDQLDFRYEIIVDALGKASIDIGSIDAVIGRGGMLRPVLSGIYEVNDAMRRDLSSARYGEHASNLGGLIAAKIAREASALAFIADPVVVDELEDAARVTGLPAIKRRSVFHALNQKAVARLYALREERRYEELNLVVAHMGGGVSVGAHRKGRVVDVNNALDGDGPFAPERSGSLPAGDLVKLCYSGRYTEAEVRRMLSGRGGVVAHLETNDMRLVVEMADDGDETAALLLEAFCYNVGKLIGSMAAVLEGEVDAVILTGGIAYNEHICSRIARMVSFVAPVETIPGENELEALAMNALRALKGEAESAEY
ncbi:MAG: butyrate kinase [Rikenellaceae bacterium]|jgi:butyrate kinase|nr:butyrate kinase [Rikenellaceae bacterium]